MKRKTHRYPIGSVSTGTMRPEDLIPAFVAELADRLANTRVMREQRKAHTALLRAIEARQTPNPKTEDGDNYWDSEDPSQDLSELFDALECYAGPYFYFGAHPGDGADYGYWLSEEWDQDFNETLEEIENGTSLKVTDLSQVPPKFRGEVAVVNDHGNVTLYVKSSRGLREVWSIV